MYWKYENDENDVENVPFVFSLKLQIKKLGRIFFVPATYLL